MKKKQMSILKYFTKKPATEKEREKENGKKKPDPNEKKRLFSEMLHKNSNDDDDDDDTRTTPTTNDSTQLTTLTTTTVTVTDTDSAPHESRWMGTRQFITKEPGSSVCSSSHENKSKTGESNFNKGRMLWVDEWKPKTETDLVGVSGTVLSQIRVYLESFVARGNAKVSKTKAKALLLSGPPGIGKTCMVHALCKDQDYDIVELNASDQRGKADMERFAREIISNTSLGTGSNHSRSIALVLDEVDGISGNADRGGLTIIIDMIKKSRIPIICICNDRYSPKIRSLVGHCIDIRVAPPSKLALMRYLVSRLDQKGIRSVSPQSLDLIIESQNYDLRSIINNLQMLTVTPSNPLQDPSFVREKVVTSIHKDVEMNSFAAAQRLLSHNFKDIQDANQCFFSNYDLMPLFIFENYASRTAATTTNGVIETLASACDTMSIGDCMEAQMKKSNNWDLLHDVAVCSTLLPASTVSSSSAITTAASSSSVKFPAWLGKQSTLTKHRNMYTTLAKKTGVSRNDLASFYMQGASSNITTLLTSIPPQLQEAVQLLDAMHVSKDDFTAVQETCDYEIDNNDKDKSNSKVIDAKTRAAFTRLYNKAHPENKKRKTSSSSTSSKQSKSPRDSTVPENDDEGDNGDSESDRYQEDLH